MSKRLAVLPLLIACALPACGPRPTTQTPTVDARPAPPATRVETKPRVLKVPDFTMAPEQLYQEAQEDKVAATAKYKGKVIEITGVIERYIKTPGTPVELLMVAPGKPLFVNCQMADAAPWDVAAPGQTVTLRGTFPREYILTDLHECQIVGAKGECRSRVTAAELGKQCDADPQGFAEKRRYGNLIVTGEVAAVGRKEYTKALHSTLVTFRTDTEHQVVAELHDWIGPGEDLKPGDKVQVIGSFREVDARTRELSLHQCFVAKRER